MSKKKTSGRHRWRWKLVLLIFFSVALLTVLKFQTLAIWPYSSVSNYWTSMEKEEELLHQQHHHHLLHGQRRKLAFLFLARNRMPLDIVWDGFLKDVDVRLFSIYIHSRPGFVYNKRTTSCSHFYNRQLHNSILVDWGEASMIEAERLLLVEALKDPANDRFVLLSDSCVPLYNFTYIYEYIMASPKSFVDSFRDTKEKRYNPRMAPLIERERWRKGSQWFVLKRDHATVVAFDVHIFPLFRQHCKRRPLPEFWREQYMNGDPSKQHNCIPDEHYVQTLLAIKNVEDEMERRALTYTLWNQSAKDRERKGWHPVTFAFSDATPDLIKSIMGITSVYYETEYRTEWCSSNATLRPCFLFARKFTRGAAIRLLNQTMFGETL